MCECGWSMVWYPGISYGGFEICLAFFNIEFFNFSNYISYAEQTIQ